MEFMVAVDGSDESDDALRYAIDLAKKTDGSIEVVHSIMPEIYSQNGEILIEDMSDAEERSDGVLRDAEKLARDEDFEVSTESLYGEPAEEIVEYAESNGASCIFVGHRGMSEKQEKMVGSVAQELVRKASIPVTVVR